MNIFVFSSLRSVKFITLRARMPLFTRSVSISSVSRSFGRYLIRAFLGFTGEGLYEGEGSISFDLRYSVIFTYWAMFGGLTTKLFHKKLNVVSVMTPFNFITDFFGFT